MRANNRIKKKNAGGQDIKDRTGSTTTEAKNIHQKKSENTDIRTDTEQARKNWYQQRGVEGVWRKRGET